MHILKTAEEAQSQCLVGPSQDYIAYACAASRDVHLTARYGPCRLLLYLLLADSTVLVLDAESGEAAGREASLQPRHLEAQPPLALVLLNSRGFPAVPPGGPVILEWALRSGPDSRNPSTPFPFPSSSSGCLPASSTSCLDLLSFTCHSCGNK